MSRSTLAIARATGVIGATVALIVGVTFAQLNTTATLSNNTVSSATADLTLWDGSAFAQTAPGFTVTNLIPGAGSGPLPFYFKNGGAVDLIVTAHVPVAPSASGFSGWENLKVTFTDNNGAVQATNMGALLAGEVALPGNPVTAGAQGNAGVPNTEGNYTATFDITPAAVTGSSATVDSFDIVFTGTAPTPL
ncbi:MAG TPA: hypothetical protein VF272_04330 [Candidatus Saccharimonadia bacterium]